MPDLFEFLLTIEVEDRFELQVHSGGELELSVPSANDDISLTHVAGAPGSAVLDSDPGDLAQMFIDC